MNIEIEMTILMSASSPEFAPELYGKGTAKSQTQPRNIYLRGLPMRGDSAFQMEENELCVGEDLELYIASLKDGKWSLNEDSEPYLPEVALNHPGIKIWDHWRFSIMTVMYGIKGVEKQAGSQTLLSLDTDAMWSE